MPTLTILPHLFASEGLILTFKPGHRTLIDSTFYNHYCLGDTAEQISKTIDGLRAKGIAGVILSYAKEVTPAEATEGTEFGDIRTWLDGNMRGIGHARPGDYIALK